MGLPRKIRRALQHEREQRGEAPARPWQYQKERESRRQKNAFIVELMKLIAKYRLTIRDVGQLVGELVTSGRSEDESPLV